MASLQSGSGIWYSDCTQDSVVIYTTTYRAYIDLSIIDEALHEPTSGERYVVESLVFLLKVK